MVKRERYQVNFVSMALGGPNQYAGRTMKKAHEDIKITAKHFDLVAGHLMRALQKAGVAQDDINQVAGAVAPLKSEVDGLSRMTAPGTTGEARCEVVARLVPFSRTDAEHGRRRTE